MIIISIFVYFSLQGIAPPETSPVSAPLSGFSSARAMQHLKAIAEEPHPSRSDANSIVRNYIIQAITSLGLTPETQNSAGLINIIATLKGTEQGNVILHVGHYDTVVKSPGAGDNGAAVSSMLETLRALMAGPPLKNDIAFLFTDGEEQGLLGAKAFVYKHPLARDIGIVLNFDARGNSGPSIMFETGDENGWIIKEFAKIADHPVASSLTGAIYDHLPNDTDFTVFRELGIQGLNFAFIKGAAYYHTAFDTIKNIDERSLQHHGNYALSLARHFGNLDLDHARSGNLVYFNLPGRTLLYYHYRWIIPLAGGGFLFFLAVMFFGFKKRILRFKETFLGVVAFPVAVFAVAASVTIVSDIVNRYHAGGLSDVSINEALYISCVITLVTAIVSAIYLWFRRRASIQNLTFAATIWCLILTLITSFLLPGGSYLFIWPLLFNLIELVIIFSSDYSRQTSILSSIGRSIALVCCWIPIIILFTPMIYLLFIGLTLKMSVIVSAVVVFAQWMLLQPISIITKSAKWIFPGTAMLASLYFIIATI